MNCLFCRIIARDIPAEIVFENDDVLAFLDVHPESQGHTLVIPKNHADNLAKGSLEDSLALMRTVHELAPKIVSALGASGYNLAMNHGEVAGQEILHTHLHIIPRYESEPMTEGLPGIGERVRRAL